ncbi:MAG: type II toxin-antitoxin system VapC family toxin [Chloroflexota bacterium]
MSAAYVDASALTKLAIDEPESVAMRRWYVEHERIVSSRIGLIETRRAVGRGPHDPVHLETIMASTVSIELDEAIARQAASVGPPSLRTLDTIHLATALALGTEVDAFVTYDDRLAAAARAVGLPVVRPA